MEPESSLPYSQAPATYLYISKGNLAVKYDTENNFQCMSCSCSTSYNAVVRDLVLIL